MTLSQLHTAIQAVMGACCEIAGVGVTQERKSVG